MVNYAKWDNVGDSSDDEAPTQLAQEVENKLAVTPPQAPSRNPQAEVLTDRANRVVNTLIERHGEDKARLVGPDERAAYREACTLYDAAFKAIDVEDAKLSSRILLNLATCHWQINEFAQARKASASALEFDNADDKGRARDIVNACDRELRQVAATKDGVDHAQAGDAALHAKDFAAGAKHFAALAEAFSGSGGEDEIHALAHLALCYEQQSRFDEAALSYDRAAEACGHQDDASARVPRRAQLAQRAQKCYEQCGQDAKAAASCARETGRCVNDPELALKCAGAFAQRYRKEKKSKSLVLPCLDVAVEAAKRARKNDAKALKTATQRLLFATVLDALADGLSSQRQFREALVIAELGLREYDAVRVAASCISFAATACIDGVCADPPCAVAERESGRESFAATPSTACAWICPVANQANAAQVAKAHARAKHESEAHRARRAAAGCALAIAACKAALNRHDGAGDGFRDASNRYAGCSEFLRAGQAALSAARCFTNSGASPSATNTGTLDSDGGPGAAANVEDYQQAAKLLAIALDLPKQTDEDRGAVQSLLARALVGAGRARDAVLPSKAALAYLESKPRTQNDAKDRASAYEVCADALAGADKLRDAAACLEKAAVYCFEGEPDAAWSSRGTQGAQHLFNAAGALQKGGEGAAAKRSFLKARDAYLKLGHPAAAQTAQEHAEAALKACAALD
jgi:hypothetical protein